MRAMAIPRLDPDGKGIHLVWSWPDVLPLSIDGYDIQRVKGREQRAEQRCETIDAPIISILRARREYAAPLGPLRLKSDISFAPITDPAFSAPASVKASATDRLHITAVRTALRNTLAASPVRASAIAPALEEFIQELNVPTDRVFVSAIASSAILIVLSQGKVLAVVPGAGSPLTMQAEAAAIDTLLVYTAQVQSLQICIASPVDPKVEDQIWSSVPYLVKGLTLPIHEADPSLVGTAAEFNAAQSRLVGGETVANADFTRMVPSMRAAVSAAALGRSGERIVLTRSQATDPFEEMTFEAQLSALVVHPKLRRVLGFGYADRKVNPGDTYYYRITGRFLAQDLTDDIYDVHLAPSNTKLPQFFTIRDLGVRFQTPVSVVLHPAAPVAGLTTATRRGIRIDTTGFDASWLSPHFGIWSAIFDLPRSVTDIVLELAPGHSFVFAGGDMWGGFGAPTGAVPPGPMAHLHFATPVTQLRLAGQGVLYALRLPSSKTGVTEIHAYASATFAAQPLPVAPPVLMANNLQQPPSVISGSIDESTVVPPRQPMGFKLNWLPATAGGIGVWPDDLDSGPPLDAIGYQIEHRQVKPPATFGPWEPIQSGDNFTVGSRDNIEPQVRAEPGMDFDKVFPRIRVRHPDAGFALHLSDVFGEKDPATGVVRPAQPPGSYHQYRIRSMDAVGRVSGAWTESNQARLEKHIPPPLPVDPQLGSAPSDSPVGPDGHLRLPPGPTARVIVKGAKGLTAADVALLGAHQNAIVLKWGWRQQERDLDPFAKEFRVYKQTPLDIVSGTVTAVSSVAPDWKLTLTVNRTLEADECVGQWVTTGGYPFRILHNDAGTNVQMTVAAAKANPAATPSTGAVVFGRPVRAQHRRPALWTRVATYPLTAAGAYQHIFFDLLTLNSAHPRDAIWVGVSSADDQAYIADELIAGPLAPRPGNESSIAICSVTARYQGQPVFDVPPPIGDVPELVTEEPTGRQVLVPLDLVALLAGALPAGSPIALERCSADEVITRLRVSAGNIVLKNIDGTDQVIAFGNPGDQANVLGTLNSTDPQRLANRYLLYLLTHSNHPEAFFQRVSQQIDTVATLNDRLAPKPGRFLYRVRAADAAGHISDGGAILPIIVRVPSTALAPTPQRKALSADNAGVHLTVAVPPDPYTTHVLLFAKVTPPTTAPPDQTGAELLRIPNRRDLYPQNGIRLRLADGNLIAPLVAKALSDADVTVGPDGTRVVTLTANAAAKSWVTLWCFAFTRDGFGSFVCGPFGIGAGA